MVNLMSINFGNSDQSSPLANLSSNPKALIWGAAGVIAVGLVYLGFSGNSGTESRVLNLSQGQAVVVENPNGGLSHITSGPGIMSASVSEEDREQSICTAQPGTRAVIEEVQTIELLSYVKVTLRDGECEGKTGWTTKTNIRAGA